MSLRSHQSRGFTLIEVMVSVALMALVATILITSLQMGGHAWRRVTRLAQGTQEVVQAQNFLRQRLSSIYPFERDPGDASSAGFLLSDGNSIEFSGFSPQSLANGVLRYHIALSPSASTTLEVRARPDRGGFLPGSSEGSRETLLPQVSSITIQFWQQPEGMPGRWVERWTDSTHLPLLIWIEVTFPPDDRRRWPPLYIEPRVNTAANCQFDVVSRRCRSRV